MPKKIDTNYTKSKMWRVHAKKKYD